MTAPWPCTDCGAPGVKNLGAKGYSASHLARLVARFGHLDGIGVGLPVAPVDAMGDHELRCNLCDAGWWGRPLRACPWCLGAVARMNDDQRRRLLFPDWSASQSDRYDELEALDKAIWDATRRKIQRGTDAVAAWTKRLLEAVDAEVVTTHEARAALDQVAP